MGSSNLRWQSVRTRDRRADGAFVYAVASTGVYCRPSCPSRRPARSRVAFFDTPGAAEAAGYRACLRCRPHQTGDVDPWVERVRRVCAYLGNGIEGQPSLATLARQFGGTPYQLQRSFKRLVGVSPRQFADAVKLNRVKRGMRSGRDITTAVVEAGYGSTRAFYERVVDKLGMAPGRYAKGGPSLRIRYTTAASPLGRLLVGATDRGVCAIALGEGDSTLLARLKEEFPQSTIVRDSATLAGWVQDVLTHLRGRTPTLDLPLDVRATAFQRQVWNALRAIPRGETRSYAQIAAAIGKPRAARAVARACATNPVALAIPCHRVVPGAGGVGGYRWGAGRKQRILKEERPR